jgi:hypothetical protein
VVIPEGITDIDRTAFMGNKLVKVVLPKSLKTIGLGVFANNKLKEIVIPENVEEIEASTFALNPLKVITICGSNCGKNLLITSPGPPYFYDCYKENEWKAGTYIFEGKKWKLKE